MNSRAQTTIELLLLLGISVLALSIIYSLYFQQINVSQLSRESVTAKNTLDNMVNAANRLYISGPGSRARVFLDLPQSLDMSNSSIYANSLSLRLSSGTDLTASADVNFFGDWKKVNGKYVTGGYYANFVFDGNVVRIYYDDYDLSAEVIYVAAKQGTNETKTFSIRNNSTNNAHFWVANNFSHSPYVLLSVSDSDFVLAPNETKLITLSFSLSASSSGNYSGYLTVIGQLNDGASDINNSKQIFVSVESFAEIRELMINPVSTSLSGSKLASFTRSFSLCNSGHYDISSLTWAKDGRADANAASWFSLPAITSVSKGTCRDFNLDINIPSNPSIGVNDANFTVFFNDGNSYTSNIYVTVSSANLFSLFFSVPDSNLLNWFSYSKNVAKRTDANVYATTGELDWNLSSGNNWERTNAWTKYNNVAQAISDTTGTDGRIPLGTMDFGDSSNVYSASVIKDGSTYKAWYSATGGGAYRIFYATSSDGLTWNKYDINIPSASNTTSTNGRVPQGSGTVGDISYAGYPSVIKEVDGNYKMWYEGYGGTPAGWRIYYATSPDGLTWTKANNITPSPSDLDGNNGRIPWGSTGKGDSSGIAGHTVIKDGSTYKMWYSATNGTSYRVYYATSSDGNTWTKYDNNVPTASDANGTNGRIPLGTSGKGDVSAVLYPTVFKDAIDGNFKMYYVGSTGNYRIYSATSIDGLSWYKINNTTPSNSDVNTNNGRLALGTSVKGDDVHAYTPFVLQDGSMYKMWYAGNDGIFVKVYYAYSYDGNTWTKYNNSIPANSDTTCLNGTFCCAVPAKADATNVLPQSVIKDGNTYKMWYAGYGYRFGYSILYASSSDGLTWYKYDNNSPSNYCTTTCEAGKITPGTTGDVGGVLSGSVVKDGNVFKMWYSGSNYSNYRIYYATSPDGITWTKYNSAVPVASDVNGSDGRLPIGSAGKGDSYHAYKPCILTTGDGNFFRDVDGNYKMWYAGSDGTNTRLFYAYSTDGLKWNKYDNNIPANSDSVSTNGRIPIGSSGKADDTHALLCSVIKDEGIYKMWYSGYQGGAYRIIYAYSLDGLTWYKKDNVVPLTSDTISHQWYLPLGVTGDTPYIFYPVVIRDGNYLKMWYSGYSSGGYRGFYATSYVGTSSWDANLVAYFKFNSVNGTQTYDSVHGNVGIISGAVSGNGFWDSGSLYFDGANDYISIVDSNELDLRTSNLTITAWVNPFTCTGTGDGRQAIVTKLMAYYFNLENSTCKPTFYWYSLSSPGYHVSTQAIDIGKWSHIAVTFDSAADTAKIFINGIKTKEVNSLTGTGAINTNGVTIGGESTSSRNFKGYIDEIKIYDRALSESEIVSDYNSFLDTKFVDANIIDAGRVVDWNQIKVNKLAGYDFGKQLEDRNYLISAGLSQQLGSAPDVNYLFADQNLLALWHFNNDLNDVFRLSNGGTGVFVNGLFDTNGHYCNGSTNYAFTNTSSRLNKTQFTFNGWIMPLATGGFYTHAGGNGYSAGFRILDDFANTRALIGWGSGTAYDGGIYSAVGSVPNYTWSMITATYNGSEMKLYVNGVYQSNDTSVLYGYASTAGGNFCRCDGCTVFTGSIDEFAFWGRALDSNDIKNLYDYQKPRFQNNLVGLWHFNDKNASGYVLNSATNIRDGNLIGGADTNGIGFWDTNAGFFDGTNDYISVDITLGNNNAFSFWKKFSSDSTQGVFYGGISTWQGLGSWIYGGGKTDLYWRYQYLGGECSIQKFWITAESSWHHYAVIKNNRVISGYRDGILIGTCNLGTDVNTITVKGIGVSYCGGCGDTEYTNGSIEEVAIWNRDLSAMEVKDLYRKSVSRLDLNVYSCSDVLCANKTSSTYLSDVNNIGWTSIPSSLANSRYLGADAIFGKANSFTDYNAGILWAGAFLSDLNVLYNG